MGYRTELLILAGFLALFVIAGLVAGAEIAADAKPAGDAKPAPSIPAAANSRLIRLLRTILLLNAAALALIAVGAAMVNAASEGDPPILSHGAALFAFEAAVDVALAALVARRPESARLAWVLRLVAVYWLAIGLLAVIATGWDPIYLETPDMQVARQLLGIDPFLWVEAAVLLGPVLLSLASIRGVDPGVSSADASAPPRRRGSVRTVAARIGTAVLLIASLSTIWMTIATAAAIGMGGCAPTWLVPSDPVFCVTAEAGYRTVIVSGRTSLPDGSLVSIWVNSAPENADPEIATVRGGTFLFTASTMGPNTENTAVTVEFVTLNLVESADGPVAGPSQQPKSVTDRYGSDGARLSGPTAIWTPGREWHSDDDDDTEPIHVLDVRFECPSLDAGSHDTWCRIGQPPPQTEFGRAGTRDLFEQPAPPEFVEEWR
jgi:hypothetical protein